ncbi:uncharacterized protein G2W53_039914 [Senna tora]|uniref:Uncharacterized protein n=1 Tax=Senna tora TaxID=362788 RepID=A0A834W417_9FABA|nr:uncharacterized protein G2W53_039914 [Senna tora]
MRQQLGNCEHCWGNILLSGIAIVGSLGSDLFLSFNSFAYKDSKPATHFEPTSAPTQSSPCEHSSRKYTLSQQTQALSANAQPHPGAKTPRGGSTPSAVGQANEVNRTVESGSGKSPSPVGGSRIGRFKAYIRASTTLETQSTPAKQKTRYSTPSPIPHLTRRDESLSEEQYEQKNPATCVVSTPIPRELQEPWAPSQNAKAAP